MIRELLRRLVRRLGYDGMAMDRLDRLVATGQAIEQITPTLIRFLQDYFSAYAERHDRVYLLQIGANDGVKHDFAGFMRDHPSVQSALVEPQLHCVDALRELRAANPRIRVLPRAFGEIDSSATLYRFDAEEENSLQLNLFSSFDRTRVEEMKAYYRLKARIVAQPVEACTLKTLLRQADFPQADILVSDIEGYDHAVVRQALSTLRPLPAMLVFEHYWLRPEDRHHCYDLLNQRGYAIAHGAQDAFCFRPRYRASASGTEAI